ncbi:class I SAM-dependent methyltransferase [Fictibacillus sp. KU28468]|uniref:class I SAM-dependent methyltransferase n=1 Tax=Fictibacillus sp. KU28468 TaxID=2991053 RepID=UPI0006A7C2F0|nr:SAM-dependent methyltransferase [Fictibacillus sp. KU28468]UZJ80666.1 SAM-dependent methyltransferase [Fictibacillus sp. KU28468]
MLSLIREKIKNSPNQVISYEEYMRLALYAPQMGYYQNERVKIGRNGDFYTSSAAADAFGAVWANAFYRMFQEQQLPFILCEIGAGDGRFAKSVLHEWEANGYPHLEYIVVESSPYHARKIKDKLSEDRFIHYFSLEDMKAEYPFFQGILFANELLDAMPVHVVKQEKTGMTEIMVSIDETGNLVEQEQPLVNAELGMWIAEHLGGLSIGQTIEVPLAMTHWLNDLYGWVENGAVVLVDYGYTREEWDMPHLLNGSLRGYFRHQQINDPLKFPGEMDLTSHVHWDSVKTIGKIAGFRADDFQKQTDFLLENGILDHLRDTGSQDPFSPVHKKNRAIRSLIMENSISSYFQVLIQKKDGCR